MPFGTRQPGVLPNNGHFAGLQTQPAADKFDYGKRATQLENGTTTVS